MRDAASSDILAVWKRAVPRNRMREILTSGSVGDWSSNRRFYPDTLGWDTDQPFGLSESVTSAVAESLFEAQRQYFGSIQTYKLFFNTD